MPSCHTCTRKPGRYCWTTCPGPADTDHKGRSMVEYNDATHALQQIPQPQPADDTQRPASVKSFAAAWLLLSKAQKDVVLWRLLHPTAELAQYRPHERDAKQKTDNMLRRAAGKHPIIARIVDRPAICRGKAT